MNEIRFIIMISVVLIGVSCAFVPHHDERPYPYASTPPARIKGISLKILSSTPSDSVVGKIRNGFGAETADITVPENRTDLVKKAIENEFKSQGYSIDPSSKNALIVRINQLEIELAQESGQAGYFAICDLNLYLKTKQGLFERTVSTFDKEESYWAVTAKTGVDTFYKVTHECAIKTVSMVGEKL